MNSDDNGYRLLTVKQFSEEKGVPLTTVYQWLRKGYFDITKIPGIPFLIPEHYLLDGPPSKADKLKRPKIPQYQKVPKPTNLEESKAKFYRMGNHKISLSFDELHNLFDQGLTHREIGERGGVSWQAVSLLYNRYFAPYLSSGWERRKKIVKENQVKKIEDYFLSVEKLSHLFNIVTNLGMDIEAIQLNNNARCKTNQVRINDRLCGVYHVSSKTTPTYYRQYYRINLTRESASKVEFVILFTGDDLRDVFVIPSQIIVDRFLPHQKRQHFKTFYIPIERYSIYNNMGSKIEWWKWESNWDQLRGEKDGG